MKQRFEAWQVNDEQLSFASVESVAEQRAKGLIGPDAKLLYVIEADTWEEACHRTCRSKPRQSGEFKR